MNRGSTTRERILAWARPWLIFALQQGLILASAIAFLRTVRALTGHTIHGAAVTIGLVEALGVLAMYGLHVALTLWLYRRTKPLGAAPLGFGLTSRRAGELALGALVAFVLYGWPWVVALATGQARVVDDFTQHPLQTPPLQVGFWLVLLVINSAVEELTNRAFPMRLLVGRKLWLRCLLPSLVFALAHLADEPFRLGAFASRTLSGVTLSMAYAATGNIWLAAGVHTGINYATIWHVGSWHSGSLVRLEGAPVVGEELVDVGCAAIAILAYWRWKGRDR